MRAVTRLFGLAAASMLVAGVAQAQKHEFGVDVGLVSTKADGIDDRMLTFGTPVDVRIGFVGAGKLTWEGRFGLNYTKFGDASSMSFTPGVNVLYKLGAATNTQGLYVTGGGSWSMNKEDDGTNDATISQLGVNVGIGHRKPIGSASLRTEVFFASHFENGDPGPEFAPALTQFGVRFGISLWH
ncbi:MAG TPA: hypothetical protein VJR92_01280 [Gemmatimonadaceae bacterium]|nr:hypothetical protein [Gemmatimonadaceae bacterium]